VLVNLLRIYITDKYGIGIEVSLWVWAILVGLGILVALVRRYSGRQVQVVEVNIQLGGVGHIRMCPNWEDIQIAHQIWTELVTRKAAIRIDPDQDVIVEVYDSWYALFQRIRQLIGNVPSRCIRRAQSTKTLVRVATDTLNLGVRPHLTKWQAKYRNWWHNTEDALKTMSPQEHQRQFPEYKQLIEELTAVNIALIDYAAQLKTIVQGK